MALANVTSLGPLRAGPFDTAGCEGIFCPDSDRLSVTLSVGTPQCPYGIAYGRGYGFYMCFLFSKSVVWLVGSPGRAETFRCVQEAERRLLHEREQVAQGRTISSAIPHPPLLGTDRDGFYALLALRQG